MREKRLVHFLEIERAVLRFRGQNVMLDADLASLYQVETRALNQAVQRNRVRFPSDFMFQLTAEEVGFLRSQSVILKPGRGQHVKYRPYAFTEHGVAMLATVLQSERAVHMSLEIVRAFIRLRRILESHNALAKKLDVLEKKYDAQFSDVFRAIRELMTPPTSSRRRIGSS